MIINWSGLRPLSPAGGCVIDAPAHTGFGFTGNRIPGIITKIGIAVGSFALASASALGLIHVGVDTTTATAVTVAAGKTSAAATVAAYAIADRRARRRRRREAQRPVLMPDERVPPSTQAPAGDQPGGAN
ncbi:hypothetical protein [Streptomyces scabiei]|uniref:hypothetical protein n=1 Tax=Streptomyces scabiei TaxID=1930 RepID=UPI0004E62EC3|nr:hypothetical protein [Streptomyces scabiei]KFG06977.1 hypothetical protein IQ61_21820 [Streptomyces scabiei]MDX2835410.1 hypothetical protein [Streptomyces scabiei]MDX3680542.1 hypothetical protein [Streptomyces scabiei]